MNITSKYKSVVGMFVTIFNTIKELDKKTIIDMIDAIGYYMIGRKIRYNYQWKSFFQASSYKNTLVKANINTPYYFYIPRLIIYSFLVSIIGVVLGLITGLVLSPYLSDLSVGLALYSPIAIQIVEFVKNNIVFIATPLFSIVFGGLTFGLTFVALYVYPDRVAQERGRNIEHNLPHITSVLYAGSGGSSNTLKAFREVADSSDLYGETAKETQTLINKVDNSNKDLKTAIKELRKETPSDRLSTFLQDLELKISTGASKIEFYNRKTRDYQENLKKEREQFIGGLREIIELGSFGFLILLIANIGLYFQELVGSNGVINLSILNYTIIPLLFLIGIGSLYFFINKEIFSKNTINDDYTTDTDKSINYKKIFSSISSKEEYYEATENMWRLNTMIYEYEQKLYNIKSILLKNPHYTTIVTIPIATLLIILATVLGFTSPSIETFIQTPITHTMVYIGIPIYIVVLPISALSEIHLRYKRELETEYRNFLRKAEANNQEGMTLIESIRNTAENENNKLGRKMKKMYNKISWTGEVNRPLTELANDVKIAKISRSIKLLKMANEVSGQINKVLDVSEQDVTNMIEIKQNQKSDTLRSLIIIIGIFMIYVGVSIFTEVYIIKMVTEQLSVLPDSGGAASPIPISGGMEAPQETFSLLYYHQAVLFGLLIGPAIGLIRSNKAIAGLKYSIILFTIANLAYISKFLLL